MPVDPLSDTDEKLTWPSSPLDSAPADMKNAFEANLPKFVPAPKRSQVAQLVAFADETVAAVKIQATEGVQLRRARRSAYRAEVVPLRPSSPRNARAHWLSALDQVENTVRQAASRVNKTRQEVSQAKTSLSETWWKTTTALKRLEEADRQLSEKRAQMKLLTNAISGLEEKRTLALRLAKCLSHLQSSSRPSHFAPPSVPPATQPDRRRGFEARTADPSSIHEIQAALENALALMSRQPSNA